MDESIKAAGHQRVDFFVSYTQADGPWAEWIAWTLDDAGYRVKFQPWDFPPGSDFVYEMQQAALVADRTVAVLSKAYFESDYGAAEWGAAFADDPSGRKRKLVPVRVSPVDAPGLLKSRVRIDLVGLPRTEAREHLLEGIKGGAKPDEEPSFPGDSAKPPSAAPEPQFPGEGPEITNLPRRNPHFTGRQKLLSDLREGLEKQSLAGVLQTEAISGLGGIGKTQLAVEYAHRHAIAYDVTWFVPAELRTSATASLIHLAERLGVSGGAKPDEAIEALFETLRRRGRWLLIYDNAERPEDLDGLLPRGGAGHVLITSRWAAWGARATAVHVDVLSRDESIDFLGTRTGAEAKDDLDALAGELGDLPLALEEAAAYIEATGIGVHDYVDLVRERAADLFGSDAGLVDLPAERRIATVWSVSLERATEEAPAAEGFLSICAFLAPDDIPRDLLLAHADVLPDDLAAVASDELKYNELLATLRRYSLATVTPDGLSLHRLVQRVVEWRLPAPELWAAIAVNLVAAAFPGPDDVNNWPECARLLPHATAVAAHAERLTTAHNPAALALVSASGYLLATGRRAEASSFARTAVDLTEAAEKLDEAVAATAKMRLARCLRALGDFKQAKQYSEEAFTTRRHLFGDDDPRTDSAIGELAFSLWSAGDYERARDLEEALLVKRRSQLGDDHRATLTAMTNLAATLEHMGDTARAEELHREALERRRRVFGETHEHTLLSQLHLVSILRQRGAWDEARPLAEATYSGFREVLGAEHPSTLTAAGFLGSIMAGQGDLDAAIKLNEETLGVLRRRAGETHPETMGVMHNLAVALIRAGHGEAARDLQREVVARRIETSGADHPITLRSRGALGVMLEALGELDEAEEILDDVESTMRRTLGERHPETISTSTALARIAERRKTR